MFTLCIHHPCRPNCISQFLAFAFNKQSISLKLINTFVCENLGCVKGDSKIFDDANSLKYVETT